jgi:hypothetical protein
MESRSPDFTEIISGILTLAAGEEELLPIQKIHSILHEMKPHESILAGLHFSVTGDVCYSRVIDQAVKNLIDWGFLRIVDGETVAVERVQLFRAYLSGFLSGSQLQAIHSTSLRYYDRLHRGNARSGDR